MIGMNDHDKDLRKLIIVSYHKKARISSLFRGKFLFYRCVNEEWLCQFGFILLKNSAYSAIMDVLLTIFRENRQ